MAHLYMGNIVILLKIPSSSPLFHAHGVDRAEFQPVSGPLALADRLRLAARSAVKMVADLVNDEQVSRICVGNCKNVLARLSITAPEGGRAQTPGQPSPLRSPGKNTPPTVSSPMLN